MNPQETALSNHNPDYFPELNFFPLKSLAQNWAHKFKIVQRISLHRCLDPTFFKGRNVKYVVVFEHSLSDDDPKPIPTPTQLSQFWSDIVRILPQDNPKMPIRTELSEFWSNFSLEAAFDTLLDAGFIEVYKKEPGFKFRDDWDFFAKKIDDDLPDYIDHEFIWCLFQEIPYKTIEQGLNKDKRELLDLIEESYPDVKNKENVFLRVKNNWFIKYKREKIDLLRDIERIRYIPSLLNKSGKEFDNLDLYYAVKNKSNFDPELRESQFIQSGMNVSNLDDNFTKEDIKKFSDVGCSLLKKLNEAKETEDQQEIEKSQQEFEKYRKYLYKEHGIKVLSKKSEVFLEKSYRPGPENERVRNNVKNQIKHALRDIKDAGLPSLAEHLHKHIKTTVKYSIYQPDEQTPWYISL